MNIDEAILFFERVAEAEKVMGPLSREERLVILSTLGKDITQEEFTEMIQGKKVLFFNPKEEK